MSNMPKMPKKLRSPGMIWRALERGSHAALTQDSGNLSGNPGVTTRRYRTSLQRFALPSDSAEAVQPNQLYGHHPCLSPERAILFRWYGART
jgi:hypothetical protein